jgi:hypothetical protein
MQLKEDKVPRAGGEKSFNVQLWEQAQIQQVC